MTKEQEIYNDVNRVLNEIFGNGNTNTEDEFKKITIDNKDDFVLKHGVTSSIYNNEREKNDTQRVGIHFRTNESWQNVRRRRIYEF